LTLYKEGLKTFGFTWQFKFHGRQLKKYFRAIVYNKKNLINFEAMNIT
jgi:hypothetical protein